MVAGIENLTGNWSIIERVYWERLFSVVLLLLSVWLTYLMFLELGLGKVTAALVAGAVSFQPMLTFITGSINIDALLFAAFSLLLFGAVRFLGRGADYISISCLLGGIIISVFSKQQGYFSLGLMVFLLVLFFVSRLRGYLKMNFKQKTVISIGLIFFLLAFSWLFYHVYQTIKDRYFPGSQSLSQLPAYIRHQMEYNVFYAHSTFYWGNFGWLDTPFSQPLIWVIWAFLAAGIAGIILYFVKNIIYWKMLQDGERKFFYQLVFLILVVTGFFLMIHAVNFQQVNPNNPADETNAIAIQGRYFFPVIGAKIFLVFIGLTVFIDRISRFVIPAKAGIQKKIFEFSIMKKISFLLFGLMVLLNFISLFAYLIPRFYLGDDTSYFSQELLDRMSQYKPVLLKEWVIVFVFILFLVLLVKFSFMTVKSYQNNPTNQNQ